MVQNYSIKKIVISTHVFAPGPAQDLKDYLIGRKVGKLLFIGHPLFFDKKLKDSGFELYEKGKQKVKEYSIINKRNEFLTYFLHFYKTVHFVRSTKEKYDLFIGSDNLNALAGIFLRRLGKVKSCVYYVIDYNPYRFKNRLINWIYHKIDQYCVKHCDETWNLSTRMKEGRKKYFNFSGGNQITVPIGIWFDRFKRVNFSKVEKHTLVYMGHVLKKQGIQYVLSAMPQIVKKMPRFKLKVVGSGEYLPQLKEQTKVLGITPYVEFFSQVKTAEEIERILPKCALAVAMYEKYDEQGNLSFTYFADPGKIKSYLASSLPILLTDVSHNARKIEKLGCGKIITNDKRSIAEAVVSMLKNEKKLEKMRQNALEYARQFDWNNIFANNLERVLRIGHDDKNNK